MVAQDPERAWLILRESFVQGQIEAALQGLVALQQARCVKLIQRAMLTQGACSEHLHLLIQALRQLGATRELIELVEDPFTTPQTRIVALEQLARDSMEETQQFFLRELERPTHRRQALAVRTLGEWRLEQAALPLSKMLRRHHRSSLQQTLVWSLGMIASPLAIRSLQSFLLHAKVSVQLACAEILSHIPNTPLLEVLESMLHFLEGDELQQMNDHLNNLNQVILSERHSQLEPWKQEWEASLFD